MSSTNRTDHYMLNNWSGSDKPTRADFVRDNLLIDTALWQHASDTFAHLSNAEKERVSDPYVVGQYQGTDENTRVIELDFTPKLVLYFPLNEPLGWYDNGVNWVLYGIAAAGFGSNGGCALGTNRFTVQNVSYGNTRHELNNSSYQYILIAFR